MDLFWLEVQKIKLNKMKTQNKAKRNETNVEEGRQPFLAI